MIPIDRHDERIDSPEDIWEHYADDDAIESWLEETGEAWNEMADRHEREAAEFVEKTAKEVENAVDGALKDMANDLAEKTNEANARLNNFLDDLFEKEAEAIEHIDERPWNNNNGPVPML